MRLSSPINLTPIVKAFIFSEVFFWSGWNFVIPIISVFVVERIPGASLQTAASAFTCYLLARVLVELYVGRRIVRATNGQRIVLDSFGIILLSLGYMIMAIRPSVEALFGFYLLAGIGFGVSSPSKLTLFSKNLARNQESVTWGLYDASTLIGMAIATSVGGFIANNYGFHTLFITAALINLIGIVPYGLFVHERFAALRREMGEEDGTYLSSRKG